VKPPWNISAYFGHETEVAYLSALGTVVLAARRIDDICLLGLRMHALPFQAHHIIAELRIIGQCTGEYFESGPYLFDLIF
jgi:hypothetical protein